MAGLINDFPQARDGHLPEPTNVLLVDGKVRVHMVPKAGSTAIQNCLAPLRYLHRPVSEDGPEPRFMVVRHPLERIVSAWMYFCQAGHPERLDRRFKDMGCVDRMEFQDFLNVVLVRHGQNRHTRRQVDFAGEHEFRWLCPLERLNEGWEMMAAEVGDIDPLQHVNRTSHGHWKQYYKDEQAAMSVFESDVILYGRSLEWAAANLGGRDDR